MFFQMFHHAIQLVKHASVLFDEEVQSSSITGLQMKSWFGKRTRSFETPIRT